MNSSSVNGGECLIFTRPVPIGDARHTVHVVVDVLRRAVVHRRQNSTAKLQKGFFGETQERDLDADIDPLPPVQRGFLAAGDDLGVVTAIANGFHELPQSLEIFGHVLVRHAYADDVVITVTHFVDIDLQVFQFPVENVTTDAVFLQVIDELIDPNGRGHVDRDDRFERDNQDPVWRFCVPFFLVGFFEIMTAYGRPFGRQGPVDGNLLRVFHDIYTSTC